MMDPNISKTTAATIDLLVGIDKIYTSASRVKGMETRRKTVNMGMDTSLVPTKPQPTLNT